MAAVVSLIVILLAGVFSAVYAQTQPAPPAQITDIVSIIERIIRILAPAAGVAFLIMVLLAAFRFMKSAGDPKKITNAYDTLRYAILGVILVAAAWLILKLIASLTGVPVTTVQIP